MLFSLDILAPAQAAILLGVAALLGAVFGSFINCLAWRLVNGESVLYGRSHCTSCGHVLGALDLIPIVSWLALRGRCRHCGAKVSPRYVLVEALLAVMFAALLAAYGVSLAWVAYAALAVILMGVALVDLDSYTIPNGFIIAALAVWLATFVAIPLLASPSVGAACWPPVNEGARAFAESLTATPTLAGDTAAASGGTASTAAATLFGIGTLFVPLVGEGWLAVALDGLAGAFLVGGGILAFSLVFDAATKRRSLGGGDVKLLFVVGLYLGLAASLLNLLVACVLGLLLALIPRHGASPDAPPPHSTSLNAPAAATASALPNTANTTSINASTLPDVAADVSPLPAVDDLPERAIPFAPAIAAATVVTLLVGPLFLTWYATLF